MVASKREAKFRIQKSEESSITELPGSTCILRSGNVGHLKSTMSTTAFKKDDEAAIEPENVVQHELAQQFGQLSLGLYNSYQYIVSSDHKPLAALFTLVYGNDSCAISSEPQYISKKAQCSAKW